MDRNDFHTITAFKQDQHHTGVVAIKGDSPIRLRRIVEAIARYLQREERYDFPPFDAVDTTKHNPGYVAYLFGDGSGYWIGACVFVPVNGHALDIPAAGWMLAWVWIHPFCRRQGVLSCAWRQFERDHGQFLLQAPLSSAMERFLEQLDVPEDRVVI